MLEERARANGLTLSEWVRDVLLSGPAEPGAEAGEVVLAEVLALRTLFLNRIRLSNALCSRSAFSDALKL